MSQTEKATEVEVFVNRRELELHQREMTGAQLLEAAGFEGAGWELFQLHGEHDPTGGQLVQADTVLHLENHERFRVIPGNRTFGAC
jgi:hypothetical protein